MLTRTQRDEMRKHERWITLSDGTRIAAIGALLDALDEAERRISGQVSVIEGCYAEHRAMVVGMARLISNGLCKACGPSRPLNDVDSACVCPPDPEKMPMLTKQERDEMRRRFPDLWSGSLAALSYTPNENDPLANVRFQDLLDSLDEMERERDEWTRRVARSHEELDNNGVPTTHPTRRPWVDLAERIASLVKERDEWKAKAQLMIEAAAAHGIYGDDFGKRNLRCAECHAVVGEIELRDLVMVKHFRVSPHACKSHESSSGPSVSAQTPPPRE